MSARHDSTPAQAVSEQPSSTWGRRKRRSRSEPHPKSRTDAPSQPQSGGRAARTCAYTPRPTFSKRLRLASGSVCVCGLTPTRTTSSSGGIGPIIRGAYAPRLEFRADSRWENTKPKGGTSWLLRA
jgi:hypothetical protein